MIESKDIRFQKQADLIGELGQQGLRPDRGYREFYQRGEPMVPDRDSDLRLQRLIQTLSAAYEGIDGLPSDLKEDILELAMRLDQYTTESRSYMPQNNISPRELY